MTANLIRIFMLAWLACCLAAPAWAEGGYESNRTVTLAVGEWAPYTSQSLAGGGWAVRIAREAFAHSGYELEVHFFPWARAYRMAQVGEQDSTAPWYSNPERRKHFLYSDPMMDLTQVFFHRRDIVFDWRDFSDLKGLKIITIPTFYYGEDYNRAVQVHKLEEVYAENHLDAFRKLIAGEGDLFPASLMVGYGMLFREFNPAVARMVTNHQRPVWSAPLHMLISKKIPDAQEKLEAFNRGLDFLKKRGIVRAYLYHYLFGEPLKR